MAKKSLFDKAKKTTSNGSKKKEVVRDSVTLSEKNFKGIGKRVQRLKQLREEAKAIKTELAMLDGDINGIAREEYLKLYEKKGANTGMFHILCENGVKFNVIPADAYGKVDEEKAEELAEKYGDDVVEEKTVYSFNSEVLERNMDAISDLIMNSKKISNEDKENLLVETTTYKIKSGMIDKLLDYGKKKFKEFFHDIRPTVQIKF